MQAWPPKPFDLLASPESPQSATWKSRAQLVAVEALARIPAASQHVRSGLTRLLTLSATADTLAAVLADSFPSPIQEGDLRAIGRIGRHYIRSRNPETALGLLDRAAHEVGTPTRLGVHAAKFNVIRRTAHCVNSPEQPHRDLRVRAVRDLRQLGRSGRHSAEALVAEYYLARGRLLIANLDWEHARCLHRRAIRRSLAAHDRELLISALNNAAVCHKTQGNLSVAERYLLRALRVRLATGDAAGAAGQAQHLARVYQEAGRLRDAASLLHRSVSLAIRHGQFVAQSFALGDTR